MARLDVSGVDVAWDAMRQGRGRRIELPAYAFQRRRYWLTSTRTGDAASLGLAGAGHPLVGAVMESADTGAVMLTSRLSLASQPWLADHAVRGVVLFPGTGFVELALRAGEEVGCPVLRDLTLTTPLVLTAQTAVQLQVVVDDDGQGGRRVVVYSRDTDDPQAEWVTHAEGVLGRQDSDIAIRLPPVRCRRIWRCGRRWRGGGAGGRCVPGCWPISAMTTVRPSRGCGRCGVAVRSCSSRPHCRIR
ncbi:polyketide synthase dehydratase domain-containing protein [Nocardia tengchongensis]|uniref:Polyketide synthase dehydratase domain-containing protein n=1 Tax=Nocardia tengchongensis TaxID=2055889 RepID=A0ABX8CZW2_9NOCA|nr:polyketide synthase dehydratase domain-containing protein [Nocardia tengchongensis]